MERKLFELRNKRNQARKLNKDEVLAETIGEKVAKADGHEEYLTRRREAEREADVAAGVGVGVVDKEKEKLLNTTGLDMETERAKKAKKEKRAKFEWNVHNEESKYKSYKKRVAALEKYGDLDDYKRAKSADAEGMNRQVDDLTYGEAPAISAERMELLAGDLKARKDAKKKFARRRAEYDDEDVNYINSDNKQFIKKIDRAYGKYTTGIRDALEKGTS
jgi:pre-mRNA-splicing factor SYF2